MPPHATTQPGTAKPQGFGGEPVGAPPDAIIMACQRHATCRGTAYHAGSTTSTLAGIAGSPGAADGSALSATMNAPRGLAVDPNGNVFWADYGNCRIRMLNTSGFVNTVAGSTCGAAADGPAGTAMFSNFYGVAVASNGVW